MAKKPAKPAAKKAAPKKPAKPPVDWVAVLRTGPDGVNKWNKLTVRQRQLALGDQSEPPARLDLSGLDLNGINLQSMGARQINLSSARLPKAKLKSVDFDGGNLAKVDLSEASLQQAFVMRCNFTGATLSRADLSHAGVFKSNFAGADLTGANLSHADVTDTDFSTAIVKDAKWDAASFNAGTKWPEGFAIPGEMLWQGKGTDPRLSGKGRSASATDVNGLMARLHKNIDEKRMQRTLDMLKKNRNQIYSEVEPTMVRGIVKSQRDIDTVYSCVLTSDGTYSCCTPDMAQCMGLAGEPCKHLLVLLIGLAKAGQLDVATTDKWLIAANKKGPRWNKTVQSHMADSLLKYKGVQAGEIDWRPTETIPEDFYAM